MSEIQKSIDRSIDRVRATQVLLDDKIDDDDDDDDDVRESSYKIISSICYILQVVFVITIILS